jgi:hypothetical protein
MFVAREDYLEQDVVICPLPYCGHKFCKACLATIPNGTNQHVCTANDNGLIRLMQENGWRQCPGRFSRMECLKLAQRRDMTTGCRSAIQKESGCNHMHVSLAIPGFLMTILMRAGHQCTSPGCNV